jgi:hypothetical protein
LLQGKSIGFLPTKVHVPTQQEAKKSGWPDDTRCVIDEWILLEYAATFLPVNQAALVEAVSKGTIDLPQELLREMGLEQATANTPRNCFDACRPPVVAAFTPFGEFQRAIDCLMASKRFDELTARCVREAIDRFRGRV